MTHLSSLFKSAVACAVLSFAVVSVPANALIVLGPGDTGCTTNSNSNLGAGDLETLVSTCFGLDATLTLQYKANVDGADEGPFAANYDTTFSNTPGDPADALIAWLGGLAIDCPYCFLVVKDGSQTPAQYIFALGRWDGEESIQLLGFWPNQGAISNVAIWRGGLDTPCDPDTNRFCLDTDVPEPGTLVLLGIGALGLALRRRFSA